MKLLPPASSSEEVTRPSSARHSSETSRPSGLKLGIVRLGRAGGKTKYALLDERDISLVHEYAFEARTEIDKNGCGATIFAYAYRYETGRSSGTYVQDILWERHCGPIEDGYRVVHKNCISVDNRLENLMLVPEALAPRWCQHNTVASRHSPRLASSLAGHQPISVTSCLTKDAMNAMVVVTDDEDLARERKEHKCGASADDREECLYWVAIQQIPPEPLDEYSAAAETTVMRYYNSYGEIVQEEDDSLCYYECRHPPCTKIERELREFSICGRCQEARYCGTNCQQRDWPHHKKYCRERRRPLPIVIERPPER